MRLRLLFSALNCNASQSLDCCVANLTSLKKSLRIIIVSALFLVLNVSTVLGQNRQVLFQGFWWNFHNNNHSNQYGDYMTELAPRLKSLGIDAVWVMPSVKNEGETWMGYSPMDHYDLGDKYQKGHLKTIFGNKDEMLRMVGVLHANGINVVQDIVWNHINGSGSSNGSGAVDPAAWNNKYKNFRNTSFTTPASNESAVDYLSRNGRFSKNWQNFHGNPAHNCTSGDICADWFGPDVCYHDGAYGQSSNATYNPVQTSQYMREQMRNWNVWYKKQVGFDGVRLDAVKHFLPSATEDFLYNMQYGAGSANGGDDMFAVGEYVGSASETDSWCNQVQNRAGTFDFSLRGALYGAVTGDGFYNLGNIPGAQQSNRERTVPFVNNHDTYRPIVNENSQLITGWDSGQELAAHISSDDPRISLCYAIILAVDGAPQIFFEDLFNVNNGKRWSHKPTSTTDLPVRDDIANLIWCRQNLNFMGGAYKVRLTSPDHLIIERSGKAIIGTNDTWDVWKEDWIDTDFAPGTVLEDYSGANTYTITVPSDRRVAIKTPPCNGTALHGRRGYSVWAPINAVGNYVPARVTTTTQEWEMANDLGDSHVNSLQQGGALPANSIVVRNVGKIYVDANTPIIVALFTEQATKEVTVTLTQGTTVKTASGIGNYSTTQTFTKAGWVAIAIKNATSNNPAQKAWVNVTYTAPKSVDTEAADALLGSESGNIGDHELYNEMLSHRVYTSTIESSAEVEESPFEAYPNPLSSETNIVFSTKISGFVSVIIFDNMGRDIATLFNGDREVGMQKFLWNADNVSSGIYFVKVIHDGKSETLKLVIKK